MKPREIAGSACERDYLTLLYKLWATRFQSSKHLKVFFFAYKRMETNDPWGMTNIVSRGMLGRIYEGRN